MKKEKVLYIAQEISPYLPSTKISDLGRILPLYMHENGYEVRTFMPRYGMINERRNQLHEVIRLSGINVVIDDSDHPLIIKVASLMPSRMQVYFIDSEDYFNHNSKTKETVTSHHDNDERTIFFTRGVLETVKRLRWDPRLIQCAGWITALVPLYVRNRMSEDPSFRNVKIVYTLLDDEFEGTLDPRFLEKILGDGFQEEILEALGNNPVDYKTLSKFAIATADAVIQARAEADQELVEFARLSGKPFLSFPGEENLKTAFTDFCAKLLES